MATVILLDQRASRGLPDRLLDTAERLNAELGPALARPFVRTAGDEMQAVAASEHAVYLAVVFALRHRAWWIGVGLGETDEPLGPTAGDSRGSAFWAARNAIETAKSKHKSPRGLAVVGDTDRCVGVAQDLDAALNALAFITDSRTKRQWEAVEWAQRGLSGAAIAERLGVSPQGSSQLLRAAGVDEERRLKTLIDRTAHRAIAAGGCGV